MSYLGSKTSNLDPVINYISNGRAYNSTEGWATYADAAGTQPVDGTGGSPSVTWSRSTTTPLRQGTDFNFVKDAANRQGNGVSYDFTIDNADLAKVLTVTFDYEVVSGTYATGDLTVYLIQDPSGTPVVIQPAGYQVQSATVGTKMRQIATFQTASNVTSYRLCFHVASVSASAYTLAVDNVVVGPQVVQYGAPVTDWQDFPSVAAGTLITAVTTNPTYGTVSINKAQWRRVGSDMEVRWDFRQGTAGTNGSGMYLFNLPAGFSIDTSKVTVNTGNTVGDFSSKSLGVFQYEAPTSNYYGTGTVSAYSATQLKFLFQIAQSGGAVTNAGIWSSTYGEFGQNLGISVMAKVPISGWSSSVQMSNDTDTRVVAARYYQETNTAQSTYLDLPTKEIDTHNAVTTGSGVWKFTCPVSGLYQVACRYSGAASATIRLHKNGVLFPSSNAAVILDANPTNGNGSGSTLVQLNAGDYIQLATSNNALMNAHVSIDRLSGPSAIAASETVAASYWVSANQAITANVTTINYDAKEFDSHGAVTTGASWAFNTPISGTYLITGIVGASAAVSLVVYKNGSAYKTVGGFPVNAQSACGVTLRLVAGDVISFRGNVSVTITGAATLALQATNIGITRIGI